ncbi:MAG TPA: ABC transporter ATP-binding protein [Chloroflexia bacterium]|nr:ABC transporter ATP-binding protein [Chloroflexia bacterium]
MPPQENRAGVGGLAKARQALSEFAGAVITIVRMAWQAHPRNFATVIALDVAQGLVPLGMAWVMKALFDLLAQGLGLGQEGARTGGDTFAQELAALLAIYICISVLGQALSPLAGYLNWQTGRKIALKVQLDVYTKINSLVGLAPFEDPRFHDTMRLAAQGAQLGPSQAVRIFTSLLRSAITILSFAGILLSLSPILAGVLVVAVVPQFYMQLKLGSDRLRTALFNTPNERKASFYGGVLSGVHYAKEVRLFNLAGYFLDLFRRTNLDIYDTQRAQQARELRAQLALAALANVVAGGAFAVVVLQAFERRLSIGDVVLFTGAVASVQAALSSLVSAASNLHESVLFFTHYKALSEFTQPLALAPSPRKAPPLKSGIELCNVSFRYSPDHPWVLKGVNLRIPAGRCVALVGVNGAGKTTLVKLLARLYDPTKGRILWDGIDLREFDPVELRERIATIFQDFVRYEMTAHENIGLGDVDYLDDGNRVRQAAIKAGAHEAIERLACGYKTLLSRWLAGDTPGADLSGGEWQKVALARLFMRNERHEQGEATGDEGADLLILDEPTSALDAQAEYDIYERFAKLLEGRTGLLITHRFSTVRIADIVAVLEDGRITEHGTHHELLSLNRAYASLYNKQASRYH